MAEISPEQVGALLRAVEAARETQQTADAAREALDGTLLQTAREAKVGLRELSAVTGMHHASIRAGIQRAAGPTTIDFEQPELDLDGLTTEPVGEAQPPTAERDDDAQVAASHASLAFPTSAVDAVRRGPDGPAPGATSAHNPSMGRPDLGHGGTGRGEG